MGTTADRPIMTDDETEKQTQNADSVPLATRTRTGQEQGQIEQERGTTADNPIVIEEMDETKNPILNADNTPLVPHNRSACGGHCHHCEVCNVYIQKDVQYEMHMWIHRAQGAYRCDQCDYVAYNKKGLVSHEKIHTNELEYKCRLCTVKGHSASFQSAIHQTHHRNQDHHDICFSCPQLRR